MEEKLFDGDFFRSLKRISLWSENRLNGGRGGSRKSTSKIISWLYTRTRGLL